MDLDSTLSIWKMSCQRISKGGEGPELTPVDLTIPIRSLSFGPSFVAPESSLLKHMRAPMRGGPPLFLMMALWYFPQPVQLTTCLKRPRPLVQIHALESMRRNGQPCVTPHRDHGPWIHSRVWFHGKGAEEFTSTNPQETWGLSMALLAILSASSLLFWRTWK
jgi:hypothetical protein